MYLRLFILLFICFLGSCKKEDPDPGASAKNSPEISVSSPTVSSAYTAGQNIQVTGTINDNSMISKVTVRLKNTTDNSEISFFTQTPHTSTFALNTSYNVTSSIAAGNYKLIVRAEDMDGNVSEVSVDILIN